MRAPLWSSRIELNLSLRKRSSASGSEHYESSAVLLETLFDMFGLFKKKDPREELEKRYKELLAESYRLSTVDRKASDLKRAEAEELIDAMDKLPGKSDATS